VISLTPHAKIMLAVKPADFRCGIDGLSAICRLQLEQDPFSGHLFVFINKRRTSLKMLQYDGSGYFLHQKRLSKGRFTWWPKSKEERIAYLDMLQLQMLIFNKNPSNTSISYWKKIAK